MGIFSNLFFDFSVRDNTALNEDERAELYNSFAYKNWNRLTIDEKRDCMQRLENDFAAQQGRPPVRIILDDKLEKGKFGGYNPDENVMRINKDFIEYGTFLPNGGKARIDANMQIFDTIAHEGFHAYQFYALQHPEIHEDKNQLTEWAKNVGRYYEEDDDYYIQPMEKDAWAFGFDATMSAFDSIEQTNGEEPGRYKYEDECTECLFDEAIKRNPGLDKIIDQQMTEACEKRGIIYDYNDPNIAPTFVEDKDAYLDSFKEKEARDETESITADNSEIGQIDEQPEATESGENTDQTETDDIQYNEANELADDRNQEETYQEDYETEQHLGNQEDLPGEDNDLSTEVPEEENDEIEYLDLGEETLPVEEDAVNSEVQEQTDEEIEYLDLSGEDFSEADNFSNTELKEQTDEEIEYLSFDEASDLVQNEETPSLKSESIDDASELVMESDDSISQTTTEEADELTEDTEALRQANMIDDSSELVDSAPSESYDSNLCDNTDSQDYSADESEDESNTYSY